MCVYGFPYVIMYVCVYVCVCVCVCVYFIPECDPKTLFCRRSFTKNSRHLHEDMLWPNEFNRPE